MTLTANYLSSAGAAKTTGVCAASCFGDKNGKTAFTLLPQVALQLHWHWEVGQDLVVNAAT